MVDLYEAIQSHIEKLKDSMYTSSIAEVVNVQTTGDSILRVDVKPVTARVYKSGEIISKPLIYSVPLVFPSGGGGILSFPIQAGDKVLLIFTKEDNDQFLAGSGNEIPKSNRRFSYNDAIAIPCIFPFQNNLQPSKDNVELKYKDSSVKIDKDGNIEIDSKAKITINSASQVDVNVTTINLNSDVVNCAGVLNVQGNVNVTGDVLTDSGVSLNNHVHLGVRAGTDLSGKPNI